MSAFSPRLIAKALDHSGGDATSCPRCGFAGPPVAVERHRARAGHQGEPEQVDDDDVQVTLIQKSAKPEKRYTFGVVRIPGDNAEADDFQDALWRFDYSVPLRKRATGEVVGRIVEMAQWPDSCAAAVTAPDGAIRKVEIPARAIYAGVIWSESAWADVKAGRISGLALGDRAVQIVGLPT